LEGDDKLAQMPTLGRSETMATLPMYSSRPGTPGNYELNSMPERTATMSSSTTAYSSRQPLIGAAAELGITRSASPAPSLPSVDYNNFPPTRSATMTSNRSYGPGPQPLGRIQTNTSVPGGYSSSPSSYSPDTLPPMPPPVSSPNSFRGQGPRPGTGRSTYDDYSNGRSSPAATIGSPRGPAPYPARSATNPMPPRGPPYPPQPQRNMTAPVQPRHQANGSNSSLRNVVTPGQMYSPASRGDDFGPYSPRPTTSNSQRTAPRPGFGNGWTQDTERGPGPRY
jgi:hypothetical protein